jgi:hypothetical protein
MNKLFTGLLVIFIVIVAISLILHLIYNKPKENFGGGGHGGSRGSGSASYQNSYNGMDADNYTEGFKSMKNKKLLHQLNGNDPCYKGPRRTIGNSYFDYPFNNYWSSQDPQSRFNGCINQVMLNCGTTDECYNSAISSCQNVI